MKDVLYGIDKWVTDLIWRWLGLNDLLEGINDAHRRSALVANKLVAVNKRLDQIETQYSDAIRRSNDALEMANTLNETGKQLVKHFDLAVDMNIHDESWAVLCIRGKQERLYFLDLRGADGEQIRSLLERYSGTRQSVDTPYGMQGIKPIRKL
jgi:hypothetical protein